MTGCGHLKKFVPGVVSAAGSKPIRVRLQNVPLLPSDRKKRMVRDKRFFFNLGRITNRYKLMGITLNNEMFGRSSRQQI